MTAVTPEIRLTFPATVPVEVREQVLTLAPRILEAAAKNDAATARLDTSLDVSSDITAGLLADGFSVSALEDAWLVAAREKAQQAQEHLDGLLDRLYDLCRPWDNLADSLLDELLS